VVTMTHPYHTGVPSWHPTLFSTHIPSAWGAVQGWTQTRWHSHAEWGVCSVAVTPVLLRASVGGIPQKPAPSWPGLPPDPMCVLFWTFSLKTSLVTKQHSFLKLKHSPPLYDFVYHLQDIPLFSRCPPEVMMEPADSCTPNCRKFRTDGHFIFTAQEPGLSIPTELPSTK
jgi:hypothetical protein